MYGGIHDCILFADLNLLDKIRIVARLSVVLVARLTHTRVHLYTPMYRV